MPPPLPAGPGARLSTLLPPMATPTQRPRCSAPARTRPSRAAPGKGALRRAAPHGQPPQPQPRCPQGDGRARSTTDGEERRVIRRVCGRGGAGARPLRSPSPPHAGMGLRSFRARRQHALATASLAATAPLVVRFGTVHLQSTTRPICRCHRHLRARVLLCRSSTHSERETNTLRGHVHVPHDALRTHRPTHSAGTPDLTRGVAGQTSHGGE